MARNEVTIKFIGDTDDLTGKLKSISDRLSEQAKQAPSVAKELGKIESAIEGIGDAADKYLGFWDEFKQSGLDVSAITDKFGGQLIEQAAASESSTGVLINALQKRGEALGVSLQEIRDYADGLADATLTSQGAVTRASTTLLSFDNISRDVFFRTLELSQDAAQAIGGDLEDISATLAEILQSPGEEYTALGEIMINFTDDQAELIESLTEAGDVLGAQTVILDEIEKRYGGAGLAAAQGLGGALDTLGENVDDVNRLFGKELLPVATDVVNALANLINGFLELNPTTQAFIVKGAVLTGTFAALAKATIAANAALKAKTGLDVIELGLIQKKIVANEALTFSQKKQIVAAKAQLVTAKAQLALFGQFALILGGVALAVEGVTAAIDGYGAIDFEGSTTKARDALREFNKEAGIGAKEAQKNIDPYRSFIDVFGLRAEARINQSKIAVQEFSEDIYANIEAIQASAEANGDLTARQKLYEASLASTRAAIEQLDEEMLGTEAYNEQKAQLEVTERLLVNNASAWGVLTEEQKRNQAIADASEIEDQTAALEQQIEVLEKRAETESIAADRKFQDERIKEDRKASEDKIERERKAADDERERQELFEKNLNAAKLKNEKVFSEIKRRRDQEDQELNQRQDQENQEIKRRQDQEDREINKRNESEIEDLKDQRTTDRDSQKRKFEETIEDLKDERSAARQAAEKALAEEIAARLQAQSAGFSEATEAISRQGQLAALNDIKERAALQKKFAEEDRQEARIAALELADTVLGSGEIINLAKNIAGISQVSTAEDTKKLQETIGKIEAQQKEQQAEADRRRQEELKAEQDEKDRLFQNELQAKELEFNAQQRQLDIENENAIENLRKQFEDERIARERQLEDERIAREKQYEDERIARELEREQQDLELRLEAERLINEAQDQFEELQRTKSEEFADSEREKEEAFQDRQREKERAFNDAERAKDEATAQRLESLRDQLKDAAADPITDKDLRRAIAGVRKDGGPVTGGQAYLVGERNPEPLVFNNGVVRMVGVNGPELIRPQSSGYIYPNVAAMPSMSRSAVSLDLSPLRGDIQQLRGAMGTAKPDIFNIVGAQNPSDLAMRIQRDRLRNRLNGGRL